MNAYIKIIIIICLVALISPTGSHAELIDIELPPAEDPFNGDCEEEYEECEEEIEEIIEDNQEEIIEFIERNEDRLRDEGITDQIEQFNGSLIDVVKDLNTANKEDLNRSVGSMTNLLKRIRTGRGAQLVLEALPDTLEELQTLKEDLDSTELANFNTEVVELMQASERLVGLLNTPEESVELVTSLLTPLGSYYETVDSTDMESKALMNSAIRLSNLAIKQSGTVKLGWDTVDIEEGSVILSPSKYQLMAAAERAAETEALMESLLETHVESGLEDAIVSTLTLEIPKDLEQAAKTSVEVSNQLLDIADDNDIEQVKLDLGTITFELNDKFVDAHKETSFQFNVQRSSGFSEDKTNGLPSGTEGIEAPILDLTANQNDTLKDEFQQPIQLSFDLDQFEYKPLHPEDLTVYRFNDDTQEWQPVGGRYDPVTNTVQVYRMHLSKYTVLKSEKNYSNIEDSWAKNEIAVLKGKGVIDENTLFAANENVSREEFASWIVKAYGLEKDNLTAELDDLDPESPYYQAVLTAYDQGIISGNGEGQFNPKGEVSREEMAIMIASAIDAYNYTADTDSFELAQYEEDLPTWAVDSVETVVENGLVDESFFGSAEAVSKEEAANILYQVYR